MACSLATHPSTRVAWGRLPELLRTTMVDCGFDGVEVVRFAFSPGEDLEAFVTQLCPELAHKQEAAKGLQELWACCARPAQGATQLRARSMGLATVTAHAVKRSKEQQSVEPNWLMSASLTSSARSSEEGPRLKRNRTLEGLPDARARAEEDTRTQWQQEAIDIVLTSKLPIVDLAAKSLNPDRLLQQVCQGRRAGTIKARVASWRPAARFFENTYGKPFPSRPEEAMEYISALAEGGGSRTKLDQFMASLAFFEKGGGVRKETCLHQDNLVLACLEEAKAQGQERTTPVKKAHQLPLSVVFALEREVLDSTEPKFWRMLAWWRLVKVWATLRHDDHRGLLPITHAA